MNPLVSVVIPVFNRAHLIERTLNQVRSQTYKNWELIVVDDCSTDDLRATLEALEVFSQVTLLQHPTNRGVSAARNTGVEAAKGDYIAFLDSDDEWLPEKLEQQVRCVLATADPENTICVTRTKMIFDDGSHWLLPERSVQEGETFDEFLYVSKQFAQASSFFLSRKLAQKHPFPENLRQYEDHYFFIDLGNSGARYLLIDAPLTVYHNDNRDGRLGRVDDLERGRLFLSTADKIMSDKAKHAFWARLLSPFAWQESKADTVKRVFSALWARAISAGELGVILSKCALGIERHGRLRHQYHALRNRIRRTISPSKKPA